MTALSHSELMLLVLIPLNVLCVFMHARVWEKFQEKDLLSIILLNVIFLTSWQDIKILAPSLWMCCIECECTHISTHHIMWSVNIINSLLFYGLESSEANLENDCKKENTSDIIFISLQIRSSDRPTNQPTNQPTW